MKRILTLALIASFIALAWEHHELAVTRAELQERYNQLGRLDTRATTCEAELQGEEQVLKQVVGAQ